MRVEELLRLKTRLFLKACTLTRLKGHDYSGMEDTLANLKASSILGVPPEKGVLIRLLDKIMRLKNFIDTGVLEVKNEKIEDTIIDIHNYADLLYGLIVEKKGEVENGGPEPG
jgi:hypothetical protein